MLSNHRNCSAGWIDLSRTVDTWIPLTSCSPVHLTYQQNSQISWIYLKFMGECELKNPTQHIYGKKTIFVGSFIISVPKCHPRFPDKTEACECQLQGVRFRRNFVKLGLFWGRYPKSWEPRWWWTCLLPNFQLFLYIWGAKLEVSHIFCPQTNWMDGFIWWWFIMFDGWFLIHHSDAFP